MTIKEVSKKYNLTADTLRYYERIGLIPRVPRTPTGIRRYDEASCAWIELAVRMRATGLPIEKMLQYVALCQQENGSYEARVAFLKEHRLKVLEEQKGIANILATIDATIQRYTELIHQAGK